MKTKNLILFAVALCAAALFPAVAQAANVTVSWSDNSTTEHGFKVERAAKLAPVDADFTVIATTAADVTVYLDTTAAAGAAYAYRIRAFDGTQLTAPSNIATITLPALLQAPGSAKAVPTPLVSVNLGTGQSITVKNSKNPTREKSKTFNVAPGKQLLVSAK